VSFGKPQIVNVNDAAHPPFVYDDVAHAGVVQKSQRADGLDIILVGVKSLAGQGDVTLVKQTPGEDLAPGTLQDEAQPVGPTERARQGRVVQGLILRWMSAKRSAWATFWSRQSRTILSTYLPR
jgi:hypothetical protein